MITRYFRHTTGTTIYAKKRPLSATWASGIVMGTENAATGEFSFSLSETSDYEIYLRVGGSPASSDTVLGSFEACCTQSSGVTTILDVYHIFDYTGNDEIFLDNGFYVYNDDLDIGDNRYSVMRITRVANVTTATFAAQVDTIFNALPGIELKGALIDYPLPLNPVDFATAWAAAPNTLTISHATINSVGAGNALPPVDIISLFSGVTIGETVTILVKAIDDDAAGVLLSNIEIDLTPAEGVVGGGGGDDAATIYTYFTSSGRQDTFRATGFATSGDLSTVAGYLDTEIAAILEDTGTTLPAQIAGLSVPLNAAGIRAAVGLAAANLDTQLGDVPTVSEFNARTLAAASYFNATTDTVARVTLVDTTTTNTDMRGTDGANTVVPLTAATFTAALPTNFGIMVINGTGEVTTSNPSTGGGGDTADVVYAYFANPNRPDVFKADLTGLTSSVAAVKAKTDQLQFSVLNQVDANALTGGGGDDAATIYNHFTSGFNENAFKADLTGIALTTDITALNNLNSTAVQAAALAAIQSYDPPTRIEATADKDAIIARGDVAWITGASVPAADIYTYFVTSGREVPFQADVITALATYDVATRSETMADAAMIISHGDIAWVTGVGGGGGGGTTYGFDNGAVIERSVDDTNPIWFSWPVTGATITGLVRLDGAMAVAVTGAITEAFAENGVYFYSLEFDAPDRTAGEGTALYKFTDGTYTQLIALRISVTGAAGKNTKDEIRAWVGGKWTDETGDNYELTITDI